MQAIAVTTVAHESDLIEPFVRYHAEIFDHIVVVTHCSSEPVMRVLSDLIQEGLPLSLDSQPSIVYRECETYNRALKSIAATYNPKWIAPLAIDEFLIHATADRQNNFSVRNVLLSHSLESVALIPWRTYVPIKTDDHSESHVLKRIIHRRSRETVQFHKVFVPQTLSSTSVIGLGCHNLLHETDNSPLPGAVSERLALAHFPVRSPEQLAVKALTGWPGLRANSLTQPGHGFHWKLLFERFAANHSITWEELEVIARRYPYIDQEPANSALVDDPIPLSKNAGCLRYRAAPVNLPELLARNEALFAREMNINNQSDSRSAGPTAPMSEMRKL